MLRFKRRINRSLQKICKKTDKDELKEFTDRLLKDFEVAAGLSAYQKIMLYKSAENLLAKY